MIERGILMTPENYWKCEYGSKTQTRRIVKNPDYFACLTGDCPHEDRGLCAAEMPVHCPHGTVGDRLYVKEAWRTYERPGDCVDGILFKAGNVFVPIQNTKEAAGLWIDAHKNGKHGEKWRSPLFMPKWAARLWLELTDVRVERVQEISEADVKAEGMDWTDGLGPKARFAILWQSINGKESWGLNPWVWCLSFKKVPA